MYSTMCHFLLLLLHAFTISANTEKVIFLGPSSLQVPVEHPTLEDLNLEALSPQHWTLRTHMRAEFPTDSSNHGQASWYLLHRLEEGKRYEVRICWAATVSTSAQVSPQGLFWCSNQRPFVSRHTIYLPFSKIRN